MCLADVSGGMAADESPKARRFDPTAGGRSRHRDEAEVEFNRIVAFSDGIFAIAITLLVLGLTVPEDLSPGELSHALLDNQGDFLAYAISFAVLARFWLAHHRFFSALERFDGRLMALNLLYLAWIALVPFTSQILGDYGDTTDAAVLYAINMILVSASFYAQLSYSYRARLFRPEAREFERRHNGPISLVVVCVFALSIPIAFLSVTAAELTWLATFVVGRQVARRVVSAP
jgi:uncharacterized membrane protein